MNIADIVDEQARARPSAPAILWGDWRHSFAELQAIVRRVALILARHGLRASDVVAVSIAGNPALVLVCLLALARLGVTALPVNPRMGSAKRKAVERHFGISALLTDRA